MTFEQIVNNEITTTENEVVANGVLSDTGANRLFLLTSIMYNLRAIKTQDIQTDLTSQMSEALNKVDFSKINLDKMKSAFKNIV